MVVADCPIARGTEDTYLRPEEPKRQSPHPFTCYDNSVATIVRFSEKQLVLARASDGISAPHDRLIRCIASS